MSTGPSASNGRGLALIEMVAERSGTQPEADGGKTVWFEVGTLGAAAPDEQPGHGPKAGEPLVDVVLLGTPIRLARAWQQHADALLREYLLACFELEDDDAGVGKQRLADHAEASEAFTELATAFDTAGASEGHVELTVALANTHGGRFRALDRVLEECVAMGERGELLAPPSQSESRLLRRWMCSQIDGQLSGAMPVPWVGLESETVTEPRRPVAWDPSSVHASELAVIAADDSSRIIATSGAVRELLGWSEDELMSRRIVSIIPTRLREDQVAAFTLQLLTGRSTILDRHVEVPALCRDGSEIMVDLFVRRESVGGSRAVFVATLTRLDAGASPAG